MVFKCQENSFLKEFSSKVLKCEPTKEVIVDYGKKSKFNGFQITLEDTILFAAGGGQPHDVGWLNDVEVFQVIRKGNEALHFTKEPIEVGAVVTQKIDWDRRFDHMQQHSGQHLLSAILENEHNLPTTSWWLGAEECFIELDSTDVSNEVIVKVEARCNELIRAAIPVDVMYCKIDDPDLDEALKKGLPKDCMETIRIICIKNIDQNLCCGTHVSNLSQLQMIKLIGTEQGKKGKTNLKFLVGNRIIKTFDCMLDREKGLTGILNNQPSKHEELVFKLQKNFKKINKSFLNAMSDFGESDAKTILSSNPSYVFIHKVGLPNEYFQAFCRAMKDENLFMLLANQDSEGTEGYITIEGPVDICMELSPLIVTNMKAKGRLTKDGKFQGKADFKSINESKKIIEDFFPRR